MPYARVRRSSVGLLGVAVLVLVLLGAGCANPFRKKPAEVLSRAQARWVDAESVRLDLQATFDLDIPGKGGARERGSASIGIVGASAGKAAADTRAEIVYTVTFDTPPARGSVVIGERVIGSTPYLRLQDVTFAAKDTDGGTPSQVEIDAAIGAAKGIIGGKWITIDPKEIQGLAAGFGVPVQADVPSTEEINALQERFRQALRTRQLLTARADLGNAKVGGTKAYHYRVGLNRDALMALIEELGPALGVSAADIAGTKLALQNPKVIAAIDGANAEAWIAKKGNDLLKIFVPIDVRRDDGVLTGSVTVAFSGWGKPVSVEEPTDAKTIQELIGPLLGGFLGGGLRPSASGSLTPSASGGVTPAGLPAGTIGTGGSEGSEGAEADADNDGLSDAMEQFYGSNPSKPDTDGDGFTDGEEVDKGYNPTGPGKLFGVDLDGE